MKPQTAVRAQKMASTERPTSEALLVMDSMASRKLMVCADNGGAAAECPRSAPPL